VPSREGFGLKNIAHKKGIGRLDLWIVTDAVCEFID